MDSLITATFAVSSATPGAPTNNYEFYMGLKYYFDHEVKVKSKKM